MSYIIYTLVLGKETKEIYTEYAEDGKTYSLRLMANGNHPTYEALIQDKNSKLMLERDREIFINPEFVATTETIEDENRMIQAIRIYMVKLVSSAKNPNMNAPERMSIYERDLAQRKNAIEKNNIPPVPIPAGYEENEDYD